MPFISSLTGSFFAGRRANAFGVPWDPSTAITTAFWMDASDTGSYTLSGSTLTAITDKAGNGTMTVGGTPQRNSSDLNSLNTFTFDGANEYLQSSNEFAQVDGSGNHWAIGVFQWNSLDSTQDSFWSTENNTVSATSKRDYAISSGNASSWPGELDLDGLSSNRISTTIGNKQDFSTSVSQNTWTIVASNFNKTGNQISCRLNGANAFTPVNDYDNALNTNQDIRLMRNRASQELAGKLAEFFSVAAPPGTGSTDISTLEKAEGYLAWKWGLEGNLPSDHPYKNSAPTE